MKHKRLAKLSIAILFIVIFTTLLPSPSMPTDNTLKNQNIITKSLYPVNENGQTYGPDIYTAPREVHPDLLQAVGVDGTIGYVLYSDLMGPIVHTPEEALAQQNKNHGKKIIPLYDKDGKTIIGKFQMGS